MVSALGIGPDSPLSGSSWLRPDLHEPTRGAGAIPEPEDVRCPDLQEAARLCPGGVTPSGSVPLG